jgi:hypothetical protein
MLQQLMDTFRLQKVSLKRYEQFVTHDDVEGSV